ncbi:ECF transporter S component [Streptococcus sp. CSL10205-OR2]|uniref:ECF transporter S component n=1 Tax=Streptococcus sp. CSL10205-OR2 TaxID=2980558 RepID=UPI0021D91A83|nr:ECF transporter S component [Streptococcus sp. CSL10205-OR2]MCU9533227.1 ECF transporter S component [Streptococcus sp. CSL10205-OR2]
MRNKNQSQSIATIAIFFAVMLVIHLLSSFIFNWLPLPIKPTLVHIPVIIASIIYGPKTGGILGGLMGLMSVITNTIIILPTSYLFSPFVPNGNFSSLVIAILPRVLIGIFPYFIYKFMKGRAGLLVAGGIGSLTNTIFVLTGIFLLFASVYDGNIQKLLATVISSNSIAELIIASFMTSIIVPRIEKI